MVNLWTVLITVTLCRTTGGVKKVGSSASSPTIMWVKAVDLLMDHLKLTGLDFEEVAAISGAGQVRHYDYICNLNLF